MATIQNDRDVLLQAAATRFIPPPIDPSLIPGYEDALQDIEDLQDAVGHLQNTSSSFAISASAMTFTQASGTTTPSTITLTAQRGSGLVGGTVAWSVFAGSATISPTTGDTCTVTGSTVAGRSVTIRARLTISGQIHDAYITLTRLGGIAAVDAVNLTSQVTGSLAAGNVSGLGALAFLNTVNLNTQTTGALNGLTQVTNLGNLAYANAVAANQIGAGTLAAGVIYAGTINANQINSGSFVGKSFTGGEFTGGAFRTAASGRMIEIHSTLNRIYFHPGGGTSAYIEASTSTGEGIMIRSPAGAGSTIISKSGAGTSLTVFSDSGIGIGIVAQGSALRLFSKASPEISPKGIGAYL